MRFALYLILNVENVKAQKFGFIILEYYQKFQPKKCPVELIIKKIA
jgi:hypothetical protein